MSTCLWTASYEDFSLVVYKIIFSVVELPGFQRWVVVVGYVFWIQIVLGVMVETKTKLRDFSKRSYANLSHWLRSSVDEMKEGHTGHHSANLWSFELKKNRPSSSSSSVLPLQTCYIYKLRDMLIFILDSASRSWRKDLLNPTLTKFCVRIPDLGHCRTESKWLDPQRRYYTKLCL